MEIRSRACAIAVVLTLVLAACEAESSADIDLEVGRAHLARGEVDAARERLERAMAAAPGEFAPAWNRALVDVVSGDAEAAWQALDALRLARSTSSAQAALVGVYMRTLSARYEVERPAEATRWAARHAALDPAGGAGDRWVGLLVERAGTGSAHVESLRDEFATALRGPLGQKATRDARRWADRLDPAAPPARPRGALEVSADVDPDGPRESLRRAGARAAIEAEGVTPDAHRVAAAEDAVLVERYGVSRDVVTGRVSIDGEVLQRALKAAAPTSTPER